MKFGDGFSKTEIFLMADCRKNHYFSPKKTEFSAAGTPLRLASKKARLTFGWSKGGTTEDQKKSQILSKKTQISL